MARTTHRTVSWVPAAAAAAAALALEGPTVGSAGAQEYSPEAIELHRQGVAAVERGDLDEAIRLFRESYEVHGGHPYALFNLGECHERLGDLAQAVDYFERYIAASSDDAEDRQAVLERIRSLRTRPAVVSVRSTPSGAAVVVCDSDGHPLDDRSPGRTPAELELPAGTFVLRFELPGALAQERAVEGGLGRRSTVEVVFDTRSGPPAGGELEPDDGLEANDRAFVGLEGGTVAALRGAGNVFASGGLGVLGGYEFPGDALRFVVGGEAWLSFYPIEVRQTGARHLSMFLDFSVLAGVVWEPLPGLRLSGVLGLGFGLYLPPEDASVPVPWADSGLEDPEPLMHLRPALQVEWTPAAGFGLFVTPVACDLDVPVGADSPTRLLVNYVAAGGVMVRF
ncbi:MAG: tetratricopeptide repeat protein [Deltaproteobacteria bacterium]|nr:tetratricopeptide repeat protein [Deltaproteobacteria bacterium]